MWWCQYTSRRAFLIYVVCIMYIGRYIYILRKKRCNIKICTFFTPAIKPLLLHYCSSSVYFYSDSKAKINIFSEWVAASGKKLKFILSLLYNFFLSFVHCAVDKLGWQNYLNNIYFRVAYDNFSKQKCCFY